MKAQKQDVYGYARVSTGKQEQSIPAQILKIQALALLKDLELSGVIEDEDASAKTLKRPGMDRLLDLVEKGKVGTVIITKLDRLTRRIMDIDHLIQLFDRKRVTLISNAESLDTASATGRMMVNMIVLMSQWEREVIGERTQDAMAGMKLRGLQTGNVPYGFQRGEVVGTTRTGKPLYNLTRLESEQAVLELILGLRQTATHTGPWGNRRRDGSFKSIALALNKRGLRTRRGGEWKPEYVWNVFKSNLPKDRPQ